MLVLGVGQDTGNILRGGWRGVEVLGDLIGQRFDKGFADLEDGTIRCQQFVDLGKVLRVAVARLELCAESLFGRLGLGLNDNFHFARGDQHGVESVLG